MYLTVLNKMHLKIAVIIKQLFFLSKLPDVLARGKTKLADWCWDVPYVSSPILRKKFNLFLKCHIFRLFVYCIVHKSQI